MPMENTYLVHYGVKGMKWGVRKEREVTRRNRSAVASTEQDRQKHRGLTDDQKRALKIGAVAVGTSLAVIGGVALYKHVAVPNYGWTVNKGNPLVDSLNDFPDDPVTIKPGSKLKRVSRDAVADYSTRGEIYVSSLFRDTSKYKSRMPGELKRRGYDTAYVHTLKTVSEVTAPSRREAARIYAGLYPETTHAGYKNFMSGLADLPNLRRLAKTDWATEQEVKRYDRYLQEIKSRGYNALIDENDADWTKQPIILVDGSAVSKTVKSHKLGFVERVVSEVAK